MLWAWIGHTAIGGALFSEIEHGPTLYLALLVGGWRLGTTV